MTARITAVSAPHQQSALRVSTRGDSGSRDAGTHHAARTSVISTMGTLTRNTEPHQKCASNTPPMTGPAAVAMPATPDHTAIAWPRSSSGKTLPIVDSVAGIAHAPPMPIRPTGHGQRRRGVGEGAGDRRHAEDREADHEHALAAVPVADHRQRQQQSGEHEAVRAADPLQARLVGSEAALDARERHREDRVVDHHHGQRKAEHKERALPRWSHGGNASGPTGRPGLDQCDVCGRSAAVLSELRDDAFDREAVAGTP